MSTPAIASHSTLERGHRRWLLALGVPLVVALLAMLPMRPELATLPAPLLGPWAGLAWGHRDCTMAALSAWWIAAPIALWIAAALLGRRAPRLALACAATGSLTWGAGAALSAANSLS